MDGFVVTFSGTFASPTSSLQLNQFISFGSIQGLNHATMLANRAITFPFPVVFKRIVVNISQNSRTTNVTYSLRAGANDYGSVLVDPPPPNGTGFLGIHQTAADVDVVIPASTQMAFHRVFDVVETGSISNTPCMAVLVAVGG